MTAAGEQRFVPSGALSWNDAGDELTLFDTASESYFALNGAAVAIWRELAAGRSVDEATDALAVRFDAPREAIAGDVLAFVDHAIERDLLVPLG